MTLEQLKAIAAAVNSVDSGDLHPYVQLGCEVDQALLAELAALPGAHPRRTAWDGSTFRREPFAIASVDVTVDGVRFCAQRTEAPTPAELAALEAAQPETETRKRASVAA